MNIDYNICSLGQLTRGGTSAWGGVGGGGNMYSPIKGNITILHGLRLGWSPVNTVMNLLVP